MPAHEITHPLLQHKIGLMRKKDISTAAFRALASEVGTLLTYEATKNLTLEKINIDSWAGKTTVQRLQGKKITLVPILRAGLGMMSGVLELIPSARVSVVGIYRNEKTLEPIAYFEKLAQDLDKRIALIVDPMLATGGSMNTTISMLKKAGCQDIRCLVLVAAPEGIASVLKLNPEVPIFTAAIDQKLNQEGYIIPGLGDAGDKLFGTC